MWEIACRQALTLNNAAKWYAYCTSESYVSRKPRLKTLLQNERIVIMKHYLPSVIILLAMAASAMAMPTMKSNIHGASPTAKNHEALIKDLKLTDKEAKPVRQVLTEYRKDLALWAAKNGPEMAACQAQMKKYHQMRDPKVLIAVKAAMKRLGELSKEQVDKREAMLVKLKGVMTKEKFAIAADRLRPRKAPRGMGYQDRFHLLGKMNLTKEQLTKIRSTAEAAMKPPADGSPRKGDPMQLAWKEIVDKILTEENRTQLKGLKQKAEHRKMVLGILKRVKLTPEQSKKIDVLWDKTYANAAKSPKGKFAIYEAARGEAMEKILTEKQRKQIAELQKNPHAGGMRTKTPTIPMPPVRTPPSSGEKK
jgi:hypothetical protein